MPGMSGPQLARAVKDLAPDIRVILASGRADAMSGEECATYGIDLVVRKPLDIRHGPGCSFGLRWKPSR